MAKKTKVPPGTWIEREMFESKAFTALHGFAPQLLILFLAKRKFEVHGKPGKEKRNCVNRDSIHFTYIEAQEKYGVSKPRFTRSIEDLLRKGFVTIIYRGGGYQQDKTVFGLSENWRIWQPGAVMEERPKSKVKRGYCEPKKQK